MPSARCARIALAGLLAVAASACADSSGPSSEPMDRVNGWSPRGGRIAFTVNGTNFSNIYVMNADGSSLLNLTNDASINSQAVWVPR